MHTKNDSGAMPPASDWTDPDDAPELTEAFFADAEFYKGDTFVRRGPGRPASGNAKEHVSLRLDRDVLAKLREGGPGWQTRINGLLRKMLLGPVEPTVIVSDTLKLQLAEAGYTVARMGVEIGTSALQPMNVIVVGKAFNDQTIEGGSTAEEAVVGKYVMVVEETGIRKEPVDRVVYASASSGEFVRLHEERVLVEREPAEHRASELE